MRKKKHIHRSGFEDRMISHFQAIGLEFVYEPVRLTWNWMNRKYTPDIRLKNGILIELKGYFDQADRTKMRYVIEQHPELDIRILFQDASKTISKTSKTTYGTWCTKLNIKYAEKDIPESWINE